MEQNDQEWIDYRCLPPCNKLLCRYIETETPFAFEIKCSNRKCHTINNRGNCITLNLVEMRCPNIDPKQSAKRGEDVICNKLLARVLPGTITVSYTHLTLPTN